MVSKQRQTTPPPALRLEKLGAADFADFFLLASDARVMALVTGHPLSHAQARARFERLRQGHGTHPALGTFRVSDAASGRFIGLGKLVIQPPGEDTAELGYMLRPEYWGQGIASRLARQLVAGAPAHVRHLRALIDPANAASRAILLRLGFAHQGVQAIDGLPREILVRPQPGAATPARPRHKRGAP